MKSSLSINIDMRELYLTIHKVLDESPVNIEGKRLIVSLLEKEIEIESNAQITSELQSINAKKEAKDEPVMD